MKCRKIILPILFLILFFGFNYNVKAKDVIAVCRYTRTSEKGDQYFDMFLYNNRTVKFDGNNVSNKVDSSVISYVFDEEQCYPYIGIKKGGWFSKDEIFFLTDANNFPSEAEYRYVLDAKNKDISCNYDVRITDANDGSKTSYVRLKIAQKKYSPFSHIYYLNSNNSMSEITNYDNQYQPVTWFGGNKSGGVVTYNLKDSGNATIRIDSNSLSWLTNDLGDDQCRELKYDLYKDLENNSIQIYVVSGGENTMEPSSSYKTSVDGKVEDKEDKDAGNNKSEQNTKSCIFNGTYSLKSSDFAQDYYKFSYNLKLQIKQDAGYLPIKEMCVAIDGGWECGDIDVGVNIRQNTGNFVVDLNFLLDDDLYRTINTSTLESFTCPSNVYIHYDSKYDLYKFTLDSSVGDKLNNGENENPGGINNNNNNNNGTANGGTPVSGCEILGTDFYNFLSSVFLWLQILGPLLALLLSMKDIMQAVASGEEDSKKKAFKSAKTRFIAAVLLLLIPFIIEIILSLVDDLNGTTCGL